MKIPEKIVNSACHELFVEMMASYKKNLENTPELSEDNFFYKMHDIFISLNEEDRRKFLCFIKLIIADSVSTILGMLDGTTLIEGIDEDFVVFYGKEEIQGELQDYFVQKMEEKNIY